MHSLFFLHLLIFCLYIRQRCTFRDEECEREIRCIISSMWKVVIQRDKQRNAPMLPNSTQRGVCHDGSSCELRYLHCASETAASYFITSTGGFNFPLKAQPLKFST